MKFSINSYFPRRLARVTHFTRSFVPTKYESRSVGFSFIRSDTIYALNTVDLYPFHIPIRRSSPCVALSLCLSSPCLSFPTRVIVMLQTSMPILNSLRIILQLISPNDSSIDPRRATRHHRRAQRGSLSSIRSHP